MLAVTIHGYGHCVLFVANSLRFERAVFQYFATVHSATTLHKHDVIQPIFNSPKDSFIAIFGNDIATSLLSLFMCINSAANFPKLCKNGGF